MSTISKPVFPFNFEIRIKEPGKLWEEITPIPMEVRDENEDAAIGQITRFSRALALGHQQEVRWNHKGSPMGHYTRG